MYLCYLVQLLLKGSAKQGFKKIRVHILTDGRDVADGSSVKFVQMLEDTLEELRKEGCDARIASGGGRMKVTMDRYEVYAGDLELELASQFFSNNFVTLE
jgi:2,3-bisphosphoglycerate-independent phosphoglycerate mutase